MGKLPTKKFIHHSSNDYVDLTRPEEPKDIKVQRQMSYLASYVFNFGPLTEEVVNYYPTALLYMSVKNMKLAELNEYLLNFSKISA